MKNDPILKYKEGVGFTNFIAQLHSREDAAWEELITHFRQRAIPYLRKKVGHFSVGSVVSVEYFVEEVFANSMVKFYELFETGEFENVGHLRGLLFRIVDNQLLAEYKKKKRDQLVSYSETLENEQVGVTHSIEKDMEQQGVIQNVATALKQLPDADRMILHHFSIGGKLIDMAEELNITEAGCRKKKQRAMEKLKRLLKPLLMVVWYWVFGIGYWVFAATIPNTQYPNTYLTLYRMNTKDHISRYFQGGLTEAERVQFNLRLAKDEQFRKEVAAERLLHEAILKDRQAFEGGRATALKPSVWKRWLPLLAILIVAGIGFFVFNNKATEQPLQEEIIEPLPQTPTEKPTIKEEALPKPKTDEPSDIKPPQKKQTSPPQKKKTPTKTTPQHPPVYAANFTVNPLLEEAMATTGVRGNNLQLELEQPKKEAAISLEEGIAHLSFSGTATSGSDDNAVRLLLFSNKKTDYEQWQPIFEKEVVLEKSGDGFVFSLEQDIEIVPGLYYYIFEDVNEEAYLMIGKITIPE